MEVVFATALLPAPGGQEAFSQAAAVQVRRAVRLALLSLQSLGALSKTSDETLKGTNFDSSVKVFTAVFSYKGLDIQA